MKNDIIAIFSFYHSGVLGSHDKLLVENRLITDEKFAAAYKNYKKLLKSIKDISLYGKLDILKDIEFNLHKANKQAQNN